LFIKRTIDWSLKIEGETLKVEAGVIVVAAAIQIDSRQRRLTAPPFTTLKKSTGDKPPTFDDSMAKIMHSKRKLDLFIKSRIGKLIRNQILIDRRIAEEIR
jgi:hypothetical protein